MSIKDIKKILAESILVKLGLMHKEKIGGRITYGLRNNSYEKMKKKWGKLVKLFKGH